MKNEKTIESLEERISDQQETIREMQQEIESLEDQVRKAEKETEDAESSEEAIIAAIKTVPAPMRMDGDAERCAACGATPFYSDVPAAHYADCAWAGGGL